MLFLRRDITMENGPPSHYSGAQVHLSYQSRPVAAKMGWEKRLQRSLLIKRSTSYEEASQATKGNFSVHGNVSKYEPAKS